MKRYPKADWEPLGPQTEERMTAHDIICLHTMVGSLTGTDAMFKAAGYGGTESTYGTGGNGESVKQWQDRRFTADANLDGSKRIISIENADMGPGFPDWSGTNVPGFTDKQLDQLVDLVAWECSLKAHSRCPRGWACRKGIRWKGIRVAIPPILIPDSKPTRRGIGYHRQGIDGSLPDMRVPSGEHWSTSSGKICPGDRRVQQIIAELIPRVQAKLLGIDTLAEWNLRVGRDVDVVVQEVQAFLDEHKPKVMAVVEAAGYVRALAGERKPGDRAKGMKAPRLGPGLRGYRVIWFDKDEAAMDSALIVADDVPTSRPRLHSLGGVKWERKADRPGLHDARKAVSVLVQLGHHRRKPRIGAWHFPPNGGADQPLRAKAKTVAWQVTLRICGRWNLVGRPWVLLADWNTRAVDTGRGSIQSLASELDADVTGRGIDYALSKGVTASGYRKIDAGRSDHHAFLIDIN